MSRFTTFICLGAAFAILCSFQAAHAADMTDNLLHYYPLATDYNDAAKLYNPAATPANATVGGTIGGITAGGPTGGYTAFTNGGQLSIGQPADMEFSRSNPAGMDFSFTWWGMMAGSNTVYGTFISNKNWDSGGNTGYIISNDTDKMWLNMAPSRIDHRSGTIAKDAWYFYSSATDNTAGMTYLYVGDMSGNLAVTVANTSGVSTLDGTLDWWLGNSVGGGGTNYKLTGGMADFAVWNTALREQEVRSMYRAGLAGESLNALVDIASSAKSGAWGDTSSWDGGAAPVSARVMDGHAIVAGANAAASQVWIEDGGSLTVASGAKLSASNLLGMQNGAKLTIQGEMTAPDVWIQGGEIALSGKLTLAEPHIKNAPMREIPLLSVSGNAAELSNQEAVAIGELNRAGAGAKFTKSGSGFIRVEAFTGQPGVIRHTEGTWNLRGVTDVNNTFSVAGGKLELGMKQGLNQYYFAPEQANIDAANGAAAWVGKNADGTLAGMFDAFTVTDQSVISEDFSQPTISISNNFGYTWTGYFTPAETGTYGFRTDTDDNGHLWVHTAAGDTFVAEDRVAGGRNAPGAGTRALTAGESYATAMSFTESGGNERWIFQITPPGGSQTNIFAGEQGGFWTTEPLKDVTYTGLKLEAEGTGSQVQLLGKKIDVDSLHLNAGSELQFTGVGNLAPTRLSGSGTLTGDSTTGLMMDSSSVWAIDIWGTDPGEHDRIDMGNLNLALSDGMTLEVRNTSGEDLLPEMIFDVMAFDDITAQLGLSDGDFLSDILFSGSSLDFTDAYLQVSGNSLLLGGLSGSGSAGGAVPEPATWLMLLLGVLGLGVWRRRNG